MVVCARHWRPHFKCYDRLVAFIAHRETFYGLFCHFFMICQRKIMPYTHKVEKDSTRETWNMGANQVTPPLFFSLPTFVPRFFFFICLYLFDYMEKREMKKKKWSDSLVVLECVANNEWKWANNKVMATFSSFTRDTTLTSIFRWRLHSRVCECATPYFVRFLKITFLFGAASATSIC